MRRRLKLGLILLALLPVGGVAFWVGSDSTWAGLPPASLLRTPLQRELPEAVAGAAKLLPPRSAAALDVSTLPAWTPPARVARQTTRKVTSTASLREAMAQALAGEVIELQPGDYPVDATLHAGHAGRPDAPIVLRGSPGARLLSRTVEALKLHQPHWIIEHLEVVGACPRAAACEHALHIVGQAHHTQLLGLQLRDFNAAIKVNGEEGAWPDHGLAAHSLLINEVPRPGDAPATPFDLVGASHWRFEDNRVWGVAKQGGDGVAYAAYMKGGGQGGRMERNLVVCAPNERFHAVGRQVGLSFGGGQTDAGTLRDRQTRLEHVQGLAVDNVVLNCNDTALDVNESAAIELRGNVLLGSGGVIVRGKGASAELLDGISSRPAYALPGNELSGRGNRRFDSQTPDARLTLDLLKRPAAR